MTATDWAKSVKKEYDEFGNKAFWFATQNFVHGLLSRAGFWVNYGEDFYSRDWDLLILLDACRWDLMEEIEDEYDWIESSGTFMSPASHSREFLHKTFMSGPSGLEKFHAWMKIVQDPDNMDIMDEHWDMSHREEIGKTAYITWNVFAQMLDKDSFHTFKPLGRAKWGDDEAILNPRRITDETIRAMRDGEPEYAIAHYMQPHTPFRNDSSIEESGSVWDRIQTGTKDRDVAWEEYKDNLRWVMDEVELLIENVDAEKVVISADHGNVVGEWGCYGHRPYTPIPAVKKVPWVKTTATDTGQYTPETEMDETVTEDVTQERLAALGYV